MMTGGNERRFVLGIETSCDDTGIAVLDFNGKVLSSLLSSQVKDHAAFGGVVPELASRKHQEAIIPLLRAALFDAGIKEPAEDRACGCYCRPWPDGIPPRGVMTAKGLAQAWGCPLVGVNHIEGHIFANRIALQILNRHSCASLFRADIPRSYLSGTGVITNSWGRQGTTLPENATTRWPRYLTSLPWRPRGGQAARQGDPDAFDFPVPMSGSRGVEFSFSGLKTAVLWTVSRIREEGKEVPVPDICAAFQKAAVASLLGKASLASQLTGIKKVCLSGGVSANSALREAFRARFGDDVFIPPMDLCTDNAAMIASAGLERFFRCGPSDLDMVPDPSASIA